MLLSFALLSLTLSLGLTMHGYIGNMNLVYLALLVVLLTSVF
ncbi:hypothetical protein GCM10025792_38340 [Pseudonocardia tropica]|uniref:Uncharacterized protein n=1 Tax=Microbacterium yannicii TaxID=671622 RepID=A0ABP9MTL3_9MICO